MSKRIIAFYFSLISSLMLLLVQGCGYSLQGSRNELLEKEQIRRIFVQPLKNDTYKAGIENVMYNALIKTLAAGRRVVLVKQPEQADAILAGTVHMAAPSISGSTTMNYLSPASVSSNPNLVNPNIVVATVYVATLHCSFNLIRRNPPPGKRDAVWSSTFTRTKSYPAATQLDVPGTTSSLINESEFDRALSDLAGPMMQDVHESMLAMF